MTARFFEAYQIGFAESVLIWEFEMDKKEWFPIDTESLSADIRRKIGEAVSTATAAAVAKKEADNALRDLIADSPYAPPAGTQLLFAYKFGGAAFAYDDKARKESKPKVQLGTKTKPKGFRVK